MHTYLHTGGLYNDVRQWEQQHKRKEQVKDYASNLQGDTGDPTNLQM